MRKNKSKEWPEIVISIRYLSKLALLEKIDYF
jgi:hypothetical protein